MTISTSNVSTAGSSVAYGSYFVQPLYYAGFAVGSYYFSEVWFRGLFDLGPYSRLAIVSGVIGLLWTYFKGTEEIKYGNAYQVTHPEGNSDAYSRSIVKARFSIGDSDSHNLETHQRTQTHSDFFPQ